VNGTDLRTLELILSIFGWCQPTIIYTTELSRIEEDFFFKIKIELFPSTGKKKKKVKKKK
jgi:hypothetical protein